MEEGGKGVIREGRRGEREWSGRAGGGRGGKGSGQGGWELYPSSIAFLPKF